MSNTKNTKRAGDTIKGSYFGAAFTGTITGFDSSGATVKFTTPVLVHGEERDGCWLGYGERRWKACEVVSRPATVKVENIYADHYMVV